MPSPKREILMISRLRFQTSVCGPSIVTRVGSFCDLNLKYTKEDMMNGREGSRQIQMPTDAVRGLTTGKAYVSKQEDR